MIEDATRLPARTFGPVTRTDIVRYQGASGDFNPIHHDEEFARAAGAPTVFAVGMLHAGYLATYCSDLFGAENVRRFAVRFHDRVWPGDVLVCSGTVESIDPEPSGGAPHVTLSLSVVREEAVVATGRAVFLLDV